MIDNLQQIGRRKFLDFESENGKVIYSLPENKIPFFILLHSLGKNENYISKFADVLPKNSFVLSIRGRLDWKVDGDDSFAWFDIKGPYLEIFCKESDIIESAKYIENIVNECYNKFPNLDKPIILGFSQGGIVALTIAVEQLFDVKAVYSHCGFYEAKLNSDKTDIETPILITNGQHDSVIPTDWFDTTNILLSSKCKNFTSYLVDCGHEMNEKSTYFLSMWLKTLLNF